MPILTPGFHAFNAGEWSKRLWGRSDLAKYPSALRRCENLLPLVQGPVTKRPGFRHIAPVRGNAAVLALIPFVFSEEQAVLIEATAGAFRFHRDGGAVTEAPLALAAVTNAAPAVATVTAHGWSDDDEIVMAGSGMPALDGRRFRVTLLDADQVALQGSDTSAGPAHEGGGTAARIYEVSHPYASGQLAGLRWAQSLDVLYLLHRAHPPRRLERHGDADWRLVEVSFPDGPYLPENASDTLLQVSAFSGDITLTASAATGINGGAGFQTSDVGRLVRFLTKSTGSEINYAWTVCRITGVSGSTVAAATVLLPTYSNQEDLQRRWRLGAWSDARGWPSTGAFFQGRLWLGATRSMPQTVWASAVEEFESFRPSPAFAETELSVPGPTPDSALALTLSDDQASLVRWLAPLRVLAVGTAGSEKTIQGSSVNEAVTNENASSLPASSVGVAELVPARVDGSALFVARDRRRLHELAFDLQADGYLAPDMMLLAEHLGHESAFRAIAFQRRPWRVLWACREDGLLVGFTYDRAQEVTAWHRHPLGGREARVLALATLPSPTGDELWIAVERRIGPALQRSLERLDEDRWIGAPGEAEAAFFLDAGLSYDGPPSNRFSGLEHLEGETVAILADGAVHRPLTVSGGTVRLDRTARRVSVGLSYAAVLETLNLEPPTATGAGLGKPKTLISAELLFLDTLGGLVGPDETALEPILTRREGDPMDRPPPLFSGVRRIEWRGGWRKEKRLLLRHEQPLPCTLAGLVPHLAINEG